MKHYYLTDKPNLYKFVLVSEMKKQSINIIIIIKTP